WLLEPCAGFRAGGDLRAFFGAFARFDHRLLSFGVPDVLNSELVLFKTRVDSKLDGKRPSLKLIRACQLHGPLGEHVPQTAFEAFSFFALPLRVVVGMQKHDVLSGHVGGTARWSEHLALHAGFNLARDRYKKIVPLGPRLWLTLLIQVLFTVDPFPYALKPFLNSHTFSIPFSHTDCRPSPYPPKDQAESPASKSPSHDSSFLF